MRLIETALSCLPSSAPGQDDPIQVLLRSGGDASGDRALAIVWRAGARPVAVVKLARGSIACGALGRERDRLEELASLAADQAPLSLPRPLGFETDGDYAALVETHLPGRRLKDLDPRAITPELVIRVADWLIAFTRAAGVERAQPGSGELRRCLDRSIDRYRATFEVGAEEDRLLTTLPGQLYDSLGTSVPLVAAHGDFADANILLGGDQISVVDWEGPAERTLPGGDLFYFLCSLEATRHGLARRRGFERGFLQGFFSASPTSRLFAAVWNRYRRALGIPAAASLPLFAACWIGFAAAKARYLERLGAGRDCRKRLFGQAQQYYPVVFCADERCLNVSLTARNMESFAL